MKDMGVRPKIEKIIMDELKAKPGGVRFIEFFDPVYKKLPQLNKNSIRWWTWKFLIKQTRDIEKAGKGIYRLRGYPGTNGKPKNLRGGESDIYQAVADWLEKDMGECTEVHPLGGSVLGNKWGTPDVVGVWQNEPGDIIRYPLEIISVEIKSDPSQVVTAFGQAIAYKLFSSKVYLIVPDRVPAEELQRVEALCLRESLGLVTYSNNSAIPEFQILVRPRSSFPDRYYVNVFLKKLRDVNANFKKMIH